MLSSKYSLSFFLALIMLIFNACETDERISVAEARQLFETEYEQMAEREIAVSNDGDILAQYADPTDRYKHAVLGDGIEAQTLVVYADGQIYVERLDSNYVFEDLRPRLFNVDDEPSLEIICIRSEQNLGAGIVIYKIQETQLIEYAMVDEIGIANRWLNIAAISDLDNDGIIELAWVQTPHVDGRLKVADITAGKIIPSDELSDYSNHRWNRFNLCLSVVTIEQGQKVLHLPNQDRNELISLTTQDGKWSELRRLSKEIDFEIPLTKQCTFDMIEQIEDNCINPN